MSRHQSEEVRNAPAVRLEAEKGVARVGDARSQKPKRKSRIFSGDVTAAEILDLRDKMRRMMPEDFCGGKVVLRGRKKRTKENRAT